MVGPTVQDLLESQSTKSVADLIEELAGQPPRLTRGFEDRKVPFRALPSVELGAVG
jgi:hypothetical protein